MPRIPLVGRAQGSRKDIGSELDAIPRLRADARGRDGGIREELAAGVTACARRADRRVESAAWTARGGLVRDERWQPAPHRRCQWRKNSACQSVRALLFRL